MYAGPAGRVEFLVGLLVGRIFGVKVWVGLLLGRIVGLGRVVGVAIGAALHCGRRSWIARVAWSGSCLEVVVSVVVLGLSGSSPSSKMVKGLLLRVWR
jgi:hypothetical protein